MWYLYYVAIGSHNHTLTIYNYIERMYFLTILASNHGPNTFCENKYTVSLRLERYRLPGPQISPLVTGYRGLYNW